MTRATFNQICANLDAQEAAQMKANRYNTPYAVVENLHGYSEQTLERASELEDEGFEVISIHYPEDSEVIKEKLEKIRKSLRAESISYDELAELETLKHYIEPGDTELAEAAGIPEDELLANKSQ
jgi:hypothetical protein